MGPPHMTTPGEADAAVSGQTSGQPGGHREEPQAAHKRVRTMRDAEGLQRTHSSDNPQDASPRIMARHASLGLQKLNMDMNTTMGAPNGVAGSAQETRGCCVMMPSAGRAHLWPYRVWGSGPGPGKPHTDCMIEWQRRVRGVGVSGRSRVQGPKP